MVSSLYFVEFKPRSRQYDCKNFFASFIFLKLHAFSINLDITGKSELLKPVSFATKNSFS